jgi:hypothetical protein
MRLPEGMDLAWLRTLPKKFELLVIIRAGLKKILHLLGAKLDSVAHALIIFILGGGADYLGCSVTRCQGPHSALTEAANG